MLLLGINETIDKLAMENTMCWHDQTLRKAGHMMNG